tara:strand:- start:2485 stop:3060 length:576 start_codon:yes stop_codon:yes gene_type:complete
VADKVNQSKISTKSGDVIAGNKTVYEQKGIVRISLIRRLFRDLSEEYDNQEKIKEICVELNDYKIERDVIGLDAKLVQAGSSLNYIEDAEVLKQRFSKKLYTYSEYQSAQRIFVILLAQVSELFRAKILPKLNNGKSVTELDEDIYTEIIQPLNELINKEASEDNVLYISSEEIRGMLYYLTGRCHIKWVA